MVVNPVSGKGLGKRYAFGLVTFFSREGYNVTLRPTFPSRDDNIEFIKNNVKKYDIIVCCGGDGTLSETITGLIRSKADIPLGYIPLGTTNDFAKTLGIPSSPFEAALAITKEHSKKLDCGLFNGKPFVYVAATGAFTQASYGASSAEKHFWGSFAYIIKGIESLKVLNPFHLKAKVGDQIIEGDYLYASVSNSTSLGGIFKLDPSKVKLDDGIFELVLIKNPKTLSEKKSLITGLLKESLNSEYVQLIYANDFKIKLKSPQVWSLDGENGGATKEIIIKNIPQRINMLGLK